MGTKNMAAIFKEDTLINSDLPSHGYTQITVTPPSRIASTKEHGNDISPKNASR